MLINDIVLILCRWISLLLRFKKNQNLSLENSSMHLSVKEYSRSLEKELSKISILFLIVSNHEYKAKFACVKGLSMAHKILRNRYQGCMAYT